MSLRLGRATVERVADEDDAGAEWDLLRAESVWMDAAVKTLIAGADELSPKSGEVKESAAGRSRAGRRVGS